jgi:hypothetical protein
MPTALTPAVFTTITLAAQAAWNLAMVLHRVTKPVQMRRGTIDVGWWEFTSQTNGL